MVALLLLGIHIFKNLKTKQKWFKKHLTPYCVNIQPNSFISMALQDYSSQLKYYFSFTDYILAQSDSTIKLCLSGTDPFPFSLLNEVGFHEVDNGALFGLSSQW